jgi:hypothetical protein
MLQEGSRGPDNQAYAFLAPMHLVIPFASALSAEVVQSLPRLALPNLARLLARLTPAARDAADAYTLSPPHERALAAAWGWGGDDGLYPVAAQAAAADGIETADAPWSLVTPAHWHVGREHIAMADPEALELDAAASRELFEAVRALFEDDGCRLAWGAPERWYASHPAFEAMPAASLDRVIGRNVDFWLGGSERGRSAKRAVSAQGAAASSHPAAAKGVDGATQQRAAAAAWVRRLQSEVQLLLYPHPINEAREARGALAVNSFWLSGCGRRQGADPGAVDVDWTLRRPLLDGDAAAWAAAWTALDGGAIARLLAALEGGDASVALTLCGERNAQRFTAAPRSLWSRLRSVARRPLVVADVLGDL